RPRPPRRSRRQGHHRAFAALPSWMDYFDRIHHYNGYCVFMQEIFTKNAADAPPRRGIGPGGFPSVFTEND
ncbi:MAG: hypothetical protein IJL31_06455, partial [Oscillospiraceae bacterium]|nr:hypothetical protein [Oscillospiraceae bacterium]